MSYSYEYDKSGLASSYLLLSFLVPISIYYTYKMLSNKSVKRINCHCTSCKEIPRDTKLLSKVVNIILWIVIAYLIHNIRTIKMEIKKDFDPLEVLGIDINTSPKVIKKKLVKLMAKYNIEKAPEGKKEEYEKKRSRISKAFNIVKNKENFARWLNNESKSGEIMAIPNIIIQNGYLAFAIYCLLLGLFLPSYAYRKWKAINDKNYLGVYFDTMEILLNFFNDDLKRKNDKLLVRNLISIISKSKEFCTRKYKTDFLNPNKLKLEGPGNLKMQIESNFAYPMPDIKTVNEGYLILMDHLFRIRSANIEDLEFVQETSLSIIEGMKLIAIAKGYVELLKKLFSIQAMIIQSIFDEEYFLLQYPHVQFKDLFVFKTKNIKMSVEEALKNLLEGKEYEDAMLVHKSIPRINIKEFVAVIENTGNINEENSDIEEESDYIMKVDNSTKAKSVFNIEKNSQVTIQVKLEVPNKGKECVHTHFIKKPVFNSWTVFITVDNILHKEFVKVDQDTIKPITFKFDAPSNKSTSEVRLLVLNGYYLKNNIEDSIVLKYI